MRFGVLAAFTNRHRKGIKNTNSRLFAIEVTISTRDVDRPLRIFTTESRQVTLHNLRIDPFDLFLCVRSKLITGDGGLRYDYEGIFQYETEKALRNGKVYNWKLLNMVRSGMMKTFTT
ncbi:hypothetical protein Tco_0353213 [Tanacetum coccineum]